MIGLGWIALVESLTHNIGKLREENFFCDFFSKRFSRFFQIFVSGLGWIGELWSSGIVLILRNKEDFFLLIKVFFLNFGFFEKSRILKFSKFLTIFEIFRFFGVFYRFLFLFLFLFFFVFLWIPFKATKATTKSYQGYYWTPKMA